jgi:hypothetical protein
VPAHGDIPIAGRSMATSQRWPLAQSASVTQPFGEVSTERPEHATATAPSTSTEREKEAAVPASLRSERTNP